MLELGVVGLRGRLLAVCNGLVVVVLDLAIRSDILLGPLDKAVLLDVRVAFLQDLVGLVDAPQTDVGVRC